ncbi:MAG: hypothetical protein UT18_C0009G0057 [candidate division CPR2 bacterium GW2011_GWC2_39_10]|uniref:WxL Interacting Protein peptidoglycan binding domain-containing protein n=1 Tax=candidate division CPR2 bacterium GW2011_GWC2_39_10 TaxID=1618345 RepID=A0A0G0PZ35_UNCC2|nr:MAG: hypothetical protein UT18_C0009G0057 [candidate division CPR2 bacterium GW2011_GWC2_39_10]
MRKKVFKLVVGIFALAAILAMPKHIYAEGDTGGARGITIVPLNFELFANPGESITDKVRVTNTSDVEGSYQILIQDFAATGEEGNVSLFEDDQTNHSFSLAKWIQPEPKNFTLKAKEEKTIYFTINVPKDAEPGGHYASVLVNMGGDVKPSGGASVASRIGSLILLRVSGNIREEANIESFTAPSYSEKSPIEFDLRVKNTGNNHIRPKGTIVITNILGQKVTEVPLDGLNVLPNAIRKIPTTWKPNQMLAGRYTATLVANYGSSNKQLTSTVSFIVFPKWLALVVGTGIILLAVVISNKKAVKKLLHKLTK